MMLVLEWMKTHVVKTTPEATLGEAIDLMDLYQVQNLPVVDVSGRLCGILTEKDILRALLPGGIPTALPTSDFTLDATVQNIPIRDYMTPSAVAITETTSIYEAAMCLVNQGFKRLPVINESGEVVGTLDRIDLFHALLEGQQ